MRHVFFSYAREDEAAVDRIREYCEASGIGVWMDRESLRVGEPWMKKVRAAIHEGAFFVLCLSKHVAARPTSVVHREIRIALEEFQRGDRNQDWLLPLRLDDCSIPTEIRELHYIDLFPDFDAGAVALVNRLIERLSSELSPEHVFILGVRHHVGEQIRHFSDMGAAIREEILEKWLALLAERSLKELANAFRDAYGRLKATGRHQLDMMVEPGDCGRVILLSIVPNKDRVGFLRSLPSAPPVIGNTYVDFILAFRRSRFHVLERWAERDLAHFIYFDDPEDDLLDMLFLESPRTRFEAVERIRAGQPDAQRIALQDAVIYPTSLLTNLEAGSLLDAVYASDARILHNRS
jgi:hypothetical protein